MKSDFDILELPPRVAPERIKAQYELLLYIHHPDHFADPLDKTNARRKCKALTAAYHALMGSENGLIPQQVDLFVPPRAEPSLINWGIVRQGAQLSTQVRIYPGSITQDVIVTPGGANWLITDRSGLVTVENGDSLVFEVVAHTEHLVSGRRYSGQIKVEIDLITLYVCLMVQIAPPYTDSLATKPRFSLTPLYASTFRPGFLW